MLIVLNRSTTLNNDKDRVSISNRGINGVSTTLITNQIIELYLYEVPYINRNTTRITYALPL